MVEGASKGESGVDVFTSDENAPKPRPKKSVCLLVLGMHRSGTSALTRVLSLLGAALPKRLMGASSGNETGHWEPERLVEYNDKLLAELGSSWDDWRALDLKGLSVRRCEEIRTEVANLISTDFPNEPLFVLKDPRICRFAPIVLDALDNAGTEAYSILTVRNPLEVAESLQRRAEYWSPELTRADAGFLWLRHMLDAEAMTRDRPRAFISYDSLLSDWKGSLNALTHQLTIPWPYAPDEVDGQVGQFLAAEQRHHVRTSEDVVLDPVLRHWVSEAYAALLVLERNPLSQSALERLSRIRTEFDRAAPIIECVTTELRRTAEANNVGFRAQLTMAENQFKGVAATLMCSLQKQIAIESETQRVKAELSNVVTALEERKSTAESEARRIKAELAAAAAKIAEQEIALTELDLRKAELATSLIACESKIHELDGRLSQSNSEVTVARQSLVELKLRNDEMNGRLVQLEEKARTFGEAAAAKEIQLRAAELHLAKAEAMSQAYRNSTSWRLTAPIRLIKTSADNLSRGFRAVRNAVRFGGGFFPTLRKVLLVYREEGAAGVKSRYEFASNLQSPPIIARQPITERHSQFYSEPKSSPAPLPAISIDTEPPDQKPNMRYASLELHLAEIKRAHLAEQRPLVDRIATWAKPSADEPLTLEEAEHRLLKVAPHYGRGLIVSLTHDDYHRVVGGVQLCLQLEELEFSKHGYVYLALHPFQPLPVLARETHPNGFQFHAAVNGERLGIISAPTLHSLLQRYVPPGESISCVVHSLLGHAPEVLSYLFRGFIIKRALFWLHDYFSICPNHVLLRNDIAFCNAPSPQSTSCYTCNFGPERNQHLKRLGTLFEDITFDIVSPSDFALSLWQRNTRLRYQDASVLPLCNLASPRTLASNPPPDDKNPVRIAFLGHPVLHKGWHVFSELTKAFSGDRRYAFHHLGQHNMRNPGVRFTKVSTSAADPLIMASTIAKTGIDVALIWPEWPETFSFIYQEATAAGALVVTNPRSGNVQATIASNGLGHVVMNETKLMELLCGEDLVEMIRDRRAQGRITYEIEFSALSRSFIT